MFNLMKNKKKINIADFDTILLMLYLDFKIARETFMFLDNYRLAL